MCDKVLEETPAVAKAWFRRGEANFALNDWEVAKVGSEATLGLANIYLSFQVFPVPHLGHSPEKL